MTLHNLDVAIAVVVVMLGVSLLITILTQVVATILAARGRTLLDSLTVVFKTVYPESAAHAKTIATDVLTNELISDSMLSTVLNDVAVLRNYRLATAVRVDELVGILDHLAPVADVAADAVPQKASAPLTKEQTIRELLRRARGTLATESAESAREVARVLRSDGIAGWFNSAMDRASQKFILKMRLITVICSIIVAFALHLDTFRLLSDVSADPELRAGLVNASQVIQNQASSILARTKSGATAISTDSSRQVHVPDAYTQALRDTSSAMRGDSAMAQAAATIPAYLDSREAGERWLRTALNGDSLLEEAVATYEGKVNGYLTTDTDRLLDHASSIRSSLNYAGFKIIPDPYHGWDFWPASKGLWPWDNLHFWGILFSAGLLSLGAPFWFNALKTLSSLRPVVASKADQDQQSA